MIGPLLGLAGGTLLLTLFAGGGKKKVPADAIQIGEADPDLVAAAEAAGAGEIPVKNEVGEVVLVPAPDLSEAFDDNESDLPAPSGGGYIEPSDVNLADIQPGDPELQEQAGPDVVPAKDESGDVIVLPVEEVLPAEETSSELSADEAAHEIGVQLARDLLAAEHLPNWRAHHRAGVGQYQAARGLNVDQDYGPVTGLALAQDVGVAPIVREWPKGSWPGAPVQKNYIADLIASGVDASREKGQGFGGQPITVFAEIE